jgi:glycine betaine/choline ABC-type transport system substrate-binding protein
LGLALVAAEACVLVRNRVEGASLAGAAIVAGGGEHRLEENAVEESQVGVLLAGSGRDVVLGHDFIANGIGLLLVRPASGVRIEGNHFERNATGLALAASDEDLFQRFAGIGIEADVSSGDLAAPVLVNNTFSGNSGADLVNRTESPLFAAGNWWEDRDGPTTVGVVRLEESSWKGTVAVGTERGEAREVLGRILQFALEDAEYRVIDLVGIGDAELVADAFRARDVDLIWWGTESVREASGVRTVETGVRDGWTAIASPAIVAEIEEPTLSALGDYAREAGRSIRFAAPERFGSDRFSTLLDAYGLQETVAGITWAGDLNEAEAMVKFAAADVAFVANLEETLTSSGFTRLEDDRNALAALPLYVALSADLLERHPGIEQILSGLGEALTTDVLHDLVGRVRLLDEDPEAVARQFLSAWKLEE